MSNAILSEDPGVAPFHQLTTAGLHGQPTYMTDYAGELVLVVSTTSHCGSIPQYAGLEAPCKRHAAQGPVVFGFPYNQFGNQKSGRADETARTCHINYGMSFPMFERVEANGATTHPVLRYLKGRLPGALGERTKWNFTKFLTGHDGKPLKRFAPFTAPERIETTILTLSRV